MSESNRNGLMPIIAQAIQKMEVEQGCSIPLEKVNLAELQRITGITRGKLRRLKKLGFKELSTPLLPQSAKPTLMDAYSGITDNMLKQGITNSRVILECLQTHGFTGGITTVKRYISLHRHLIPAKRQIIASQGSRGTRYTTEPGESFQMDWGFTNVLDPTGSTYSVACFAMICHHCGYFYIEFFTNAKQENLFIGMLHAFYYMGIPEYVLTDNMKSVVTKRDIEGHPVWQADYASFMETIGFKTKLCKPRHPFTKGKVERLVRFVKENFLAGRSFMNVTDLNSAALEWCNHQNNVLRKSTSMRPYKEHTTACAKNLKQFILTEEVKLFLCPLRKVSFDGFVNYEGRRFGVPYSYSGQFARIRRKGDTLYIYSSDLKQLLTTHPVTWSKRDQLCPAQFEPSRQPEEFATAVIKTTIQQLPSPISNVSFEKFNFDKVVK